MSGKIYDSTLSGILGVLIATSGLIGSAFSRDPIYAIFSFALASIVIVCMNIGKKRSNRSMPQRPIAFEALERTYSKAKVILKEPETSATRTTQIVETASEKWVLREPTTSHSNTRILENSSNRTASSKSASSAEIKLVDAPA